MTKDEALRATPHEVCRAVMLKLYRETASATEYETAALLGCSQPIISMWLAGQRGMGLKYRLAAGAYLETP